jgi:DNA-binding beta-propeller fold protein YncE
MAFRSTNSCRRGWGSLAAFAGLAVVALSVLIPWRGGEVLPGSSEQRARLRPTGEPQLISVAPWASEGGAMCEWMPASASGAFGVSLLQEPSPRPARATVPAGTTIDIDREPARVIRDTYPTYSAVAVDLNTNEVYLQDENLFGLKVFNRLDDTPPTANFTEPKRVVGGLQTKLEFNCAIYVDPRTGDVYSVNNDTVDHMVVFPRDARGNVAPMRELRTPHGSFGIAVDEVNQELSLSVQHDHAVVTYRKNAKDLDEPIRLLQGDRTQIADPHGVAVDTKNRLLFVANHGSRYTAAGERPPEMPRHWPLGRDTEEVPGSGDFTPASITVYPLQASGNTAPLRVIQGPKTLLNWPATLFVDEEHGDLYVANDAGDSVLVFRVSDNGDVAPARAISGPRTGLKYPTGVFVDPKNDELWVSNMGNHSATVYSRTANGNVAPLRTIRSAPLGKQALSIGNPGAVEYDTRRDEILVPN